MIINKFIKSHYPKINTFEYKSTILLQGSIGLKVLEKGFIELNQYNAIKHFFKRFLKKGRKRKGKVWFRIFSEFYVTKKSLGNARMGKGKGSVDRLMLVVKKGQIIFEININNIGISEKEVIMLLKQCSLKIPLKSKIFFSKK